MKEAKESILVIGGREKDGIFSRLPSSEVIVVDQFGIVYISNRFNHRIIRWAKGANEGGITVGGYDQGSQPTQLNSPVGLSFHREGNIFVVDATNVRIQKFEAF